MRIFLLIIITCMLAASGCAKSGGDNTNGDATATQVLTITQQQLDQINPDSTYDDLVKLIGTKLKPIKENGDLRTYEFKVADKEGLFADLTYGKSGKLSEKNIFKK